MVMKGFKSFASETNINLENAMNVVVGPNGSGKSARWDTEVLLASGDKKPIGEIVEESLKQSKTSKKIDDGILTEENPLGIRVLSINPITMKTEESEVKAFMRREGEPHLYTIKTGTGKEVTTTACHPVMVYRDGKIVSEIVENLKQGDFIATPNKINLAGNNLKVNIKDLTQEKSNSEEFSRFMGYIVGDGCIIKNSRIDFVNADPEIIEDYEQAANSLGFKVSISPRNNTIAKNVYLYSRKFANNLIDFFNNNYKKEGKHIPKEILFGEMGRLSNFLAALFDCDSSVRKDNPTFEYVTMSNELANNVILALLRFGIVARKTKKMKYAANTVLKNKKAYFFITVEGKEKISQLYQNIHLKCIHKKELLRKWAENPVECNTNNDLLPLEVNKEIKKVFQLCGIKIKPIRKEYPLLSAYTENRCNASRSGLKRIIPLIREKLNLLLETYEKISLNQPCLINCMGELNLSGQETSRQIGINQCIVMRDWASGRFNAKPENLSKFYYFIKNLLEERVMRIRDSLSLLQNLANSDIFWDKIKKIEKVKGEEFVYDLTIEDNHNFVANNIFVHNSNVTDSICFVLGRLSAKSMRAAKSANLIFAGTNLHKAAPEAVVKLIFDNSDKGFPIEKSEIIIERILRHNGQSIYKINQEIKTRNEVLELLSVAGIDPNGYNIVLQGEIQSFVKMRPEERRQVIEEVAGISVYETRKGKSLHELEKTEEKLREVSAILRERTAYLKNLEQERQQALKFKHLEETVKKCKASILSKQIEEKQKELKKIEEEADKKAKIKEKHRSNIQEIQNQIITLETKINEINSHIQKSTGIEQDTLYAELTELREKLAGLSVHKDNAERKLEEVSSRKARAEQNIKELEIQIAELQKKSPLQAKKQQELEKKKQIFEELEKDKRKFYSIKQELTNLKQRTEDKRVQLQRNKNESDFILQEITKLGESLKHKSLQQAQEALKNKKQEVIDSSSKLDSLEEKKLKLEKSISIFQSQVNEHNDIKIQVSKLDICPLCKSKITEEHLKHVYSDCDLKVSSLSSSLKNERQEITDISNEISSLKLAIDSAKQLISSIEVELVKLSNVESRTNNLKRLESEKKSLELELTELLKSRERYEEMESKFKYSEEKYEQTLLEIEQISSRTEENIDVELEMKNRDLNQTKVSIKQSLRDEEDLKLEIKEKGREIEEKSSLLEEKEVQEKKLKEKFNKLFEERTKFQKELQELNNNLITKQHDLQLHESEINELKIYRARIDAEKQTVDTDFLTFSGIELISGSIEFLKDKLQKSEDSIRIIGSVNMKALEVYDEIKKEYDSIAEKAAQLENEKLEIMKIIEEIDMKKRKTFMKTLSSINELFTRNFMQLYTKGQAFLDLENKEDPFAAGLDIIIKVGKGKYFDVTSLSGGEQTLVALSLIFAIQEHKPYCFYIFDEIDAALDKRNSEKLAALIKKHIKSGQYIIVTHNDALMTEASILYGVTMQDGISKIISLQI